MSETYTIKAKTLWQFISLVLLVALVASVSTGGFGRGRTETANDGNSANNNPSNNGNTAAIAPTPAITNTEALKLSADDVVKGKADAPVTIIEYSDPSCPFCAAAAGNPKYVQYMQSRDSTWQAPVPGVINEYVDAGKVKLVYRYFPGHGLGEDTMKYMLCANEQGKFWELHDAFFNDQDTLNSLVQAGDAAKTNAERDKLATSAGIDTKKIATCLASKKYDTAPARDTASGRAAGVSGTPAFFINGQLVEGAQSFTALKSVIDSKLAN